VRFKQRKVETSEIRDPQLEYARLVRQQAEEGGGRRKHARMNPPLAVDADFCFAEDVKK